ncbi:MAG TPA: LssY C-terminal domain-containing protein [Bryobacteraceae bacterium]|nr:LssY C-terminal domain-containing protein [Bryobacteraceae bacterium]
MATGSRVSHRGDLIEATIIAPISGQGRILVPQGARLLGSIAEAHALGLGLKRSTANLSYDFDTLRYPNGATVAVHTRLIAAETAKEHVDSFGVVHGIHPVASLSSNLSFYVFPLLVLDPGVGIPVWAVKSLVAPSANPEIYFPAGTELILQLTTAVEVPRTLGNFVRVKPLVPSSVTDVAHLLKISPQRAYLGNHPSDTVNLVLMGSREQMDRAFQAAGWFQAQRKSPMALYRMYSALCHRHGYSKAPMNTLTLNGAPAAFVRQKGLNTVEKRHHVRFWQAPGHADVWLGTAAEDVGFRFELTHWTHYINPHIDNERAKVVNDLAFTGCVGAAGLVSRPSGELKHDSEAEQGTVSDGKVAVAQLNSCRDPERMAGVGGAPTVHQQGRVTRGLTAFRKDLVRSNIFFTAYNTVKLLATSQRLPVAASIPVTSAEARNLNWLTAAGRATKSSGTIASASNERRDRPE